jgi:hypothetical protein
LKEIQLTVASYPVATKLPIAAIRYSTLPHCPAPKQGWSDSSTLLTKLLSEEIIFAKCTPDVFYYIKRQITQSHAIPITSRPCLLHLHCIDQGGYFD